MEFIASETKGSSVVKNQNITTPITKTKQNAFSTKIQDRILD
jgi:hypothetical protein